MKVVKKDKMMKKILKQIIILIVLIFFLSLILEFFFNRDFYINKNNRFLFSKKVNKIEINYFIEKYFSMANAFFQGFKLCHSKIEDDNLNFVLFDNEDGFYDSSKNIYYKLFMDYYRQKKGNIQKLIYSFGIEKEDYKYCYGLDTILIKNNYFLSTILAYHKHLIYKNLPDHIKVLFDLESGIKPNILKGYNYSDFMKNYLEIKLLIDSISSFYEYLYWNIKDDNNKSFNLEEYSKRFIATNENIKIKYKDYDEFYIDFITDSLDNDEELYGRIKNLLIIKLIELKGINTFQNFIYKIYNEPVYDFELLFEKIFGISLVKFFQLLINSQ